jgi:hypothetical protein
MLLYISFVLLASLSFSIASFYDNPELESPGESGTPLDELKQKWDFDVSALPSTTQHHFVMVPVSLRGKETMRHA